MFQVELARREQRPLRIAIMGPSGAGKTLSALLIAHELCRILGYKNPPGVIDTESGSASTYMGATVGGIGPLRYTRIDLTNARGQYSPENYAKALDAHAAAGTPVCIVDSLSHAWSGPGGILDFVDRQDGASKFSSGWKKATPIQHELTRKLITYPGHLIVTLRVKTEYVIEENAKGKKEPRKVGLQAVQRDGMEYEFDVVLDINADHVAVVTKSRALNLSGMIFDRPGTELARLLAEWYTDGAVPDEAAPQTQVEQVEPEPEPTATHRKLTLETLNAATGLGIESLDVYQGFIVERANGRTVTPILERSPDEIVKLARSLGSEGNVTRLRGYVAMLERQRAEREQGGVA